MIDARVMELRIEDSKLRTARGLLDDLEEDIPGLPFRGGVPASDVVEVVVQHLTDEVQVRLLFEVTEHIEVTLPPKTGPEVVLAYAAF